MAVLSWRLINIKGKLLVEIVKRDTVVSLSLLRYYLEDTAQVPNDFTSASAVCASVARQHESQGCSIRPPAQWASLTLKWILTHNLNKFLFSLREWINYSMLIIKIYPGTLVNGFWFPVKEKIKIVDGMTDFYQLDTNLDRSQKRAS